jgi:hypothetical protein
MVGVVRGVGDAGGEARAVHPTAPAKRPRAENTRAPAIRAMIAQRSIASGLWPGGAAVKPGPRIPSTEAGPALWRLGPRRDSDLRLTAMGDQW